MLSSQLKDTLSFAVNNTMDFCNSEIEKTKVSMCTLMQDTMVESFANKYRSYGREKETDTIRTIISTMKIEGANSELASNMMLIFGNYDVVIDANGQYRKYEVFDKYFKDCYNNEQQWLNEIFSVNRKSLIKRYVSSDGKTNVILIQKSVKNIGGQPPVVSIVFIDEKKLFHIDDSNNGSTETKIYVLSKENEVIFRSDNEDISNLKIENNQKLKLNGEKYIMSIAETDEYKYVQLFKNSKYANRLNYMFLFGLLWNILCLVVGVGMAAYFSNINYTPIKNILSKFGQNFEDKSENEYALIEHEIELMLKKGNDIQKLFNEKMRWLRDVFWKDLFNVTNSREAKKVIKKYNIQFKGKHYILAMFDVENFGMLKTIKNNESGNLCNFVISNVYSELMNDIANCEYFVFEGMYYCIIVSEKNNISDVVYDNANELSSFLKENFNVDINCYISRVGDLEGFAELRSQVNTISEFGHFMNGNKVIAYSDVEVAVIECYVTNFEQGLIDSVKSGNSEEVIKMVNEIFATEFSMYSMNVSIKNILKDSIISTLLKLSEEIDYDDGSNLISVIEAANTMKNIEVKITKYAEELAKYYMKQNDTDDDKITKIIHFVEENYSNPDLNVSYIADKFNISISHLSRYFKAKTGEGLAKYILNYRCQKAKEYIENTDYSIAKISELCGIETTGSFIHAFKRIYNITPGKYLNEHNNKDGDND